VIVTLTLNPSLDRTVEVPSLSRGSVIRASSGRLDPGGKGVNVARALLANGVDACAVLPAGGSVGHQLVELLEAEEVAMAAVPVAGATRSNLTLSEPDGTVTKINESGASLTAAEIDLLADTVMGLVGPHDWAVLSGSVPPGVDHGVYAHLTARFVASGIAVAVDTSGPALVQAVKARPTLVKPNREELAEAVGREVHSLADAVEAALVLREAGAGTVLASAVGAGDCLLAGFLAGGAGGADALATGLCWAGAAVGLPGSRVPTPVDIAQRRAHLTNDVNRHRALTVPT
jgi:1-phosphofructokinase